MLESFVHAKVEYTIQTIIIDSLITQLYVQGTARRPSNGAIVWQ